MSNEIENKAEELLTTAGIEYRANYAGEQKNAFGDKGHTMDKWLCTFSKGAKIEEFEYFTGLGFRTPAPKPSNGGPVPLKNTIFWERLEKLRQPQAPHVAGVLHSLLLDGDAVGQSFENWCSEYGYDNDSRKAYATYQACQKNADKLSRVIDHKTREALREALQDY